jgi:tetratricopeptide (TPR) repeat protein
MMLTLLLLTSLAFGSPATSPAQGAYAIAGNVFGADGRGVDSIRVSLMDDSYRVLKTVFSEHSGRYVFRGIRPGSYTVRVTPVGLPYEELNQKVDLPQGFTRNAEEMVTLDLILKLKRTSTSAGRSGVVFVQSVPEAAQAEYKKGSDSLKNNKWQEGQLALSKAIELFPDYFIALELLGTEYTKRGEFETAVPILTHALEVNRSASKALYALGVAYLKLNHAREATDWLRKAAQQDPNNANVHMMLGISYGQVGALSDAKESLDKAYQLGGADVADVHLYLAGIYNKQEKYSAGVRELELYMKEKKDGDIDPMKVNAMIEKLKAKEKAKKLSGQ